ncbi:MAG: redox-sensing transcriptional repressor Rex [Gemmataceae bacterium]|nr:redox-sensing transcriptional repressor Rex [Gemmataceae bacterium]
MTDESRPPRATAARLSLYLRCLEGWLRAGQQSASSHDLAQALLLGDAQVRKDLAYLGGLGRRGVGYKTATLIAAIHKALGIDREWPVVVLGAGNLARALLRYRGFKDRGFRIVGLFDSDPHLIGQKVDGQEVFPASELRRRVAETKAEFGVIAVPSESAQEVADTLVKAGIRGILNFAPALLRLPKGLAVVNVDLTIQLEQLAFQVLAGAE